MSSAPNGRRRRILVVDDSRVNRSVAEAMLRHLGHDVASAADGLEALAALESASYDLVLMDCQMPGMDGFDATLELRKREGANPAMGHTLVVAVSGGAAADEGERYRTAGMDDCLAKPFGLKELDGLLSRWLGGPARPAA
jgi:CheY-like chemotaxis protein